MICAAIRFGVCRSVSEWGWRLGPGLSADGGVLVFGYSTMTIVFED